MRRFLTILPLALAFSLAGAAPILGPSTLGPQHVAVVYNQKVPTSLAVALAYVQARGIDPDRMIGLDCSTQETISRKEFRDTIQEPLRRAFADREWWQLERTDNGIIATKPKIRVLALMHGMPLRISRDTTAATGKLDKAAINEASVDSELMLLGAFNAPIDAALNNPYFRKKEDFARFGETSMFLVARLDGSDATIATRLATEAAEVERSGGPWGRAVVDLAGKGGGYQLGDDWLLNVFNDCWASGIPAQIDRHPWTIPDFYPMADCALYYGWYEGNRNGFLLNPDFRFRKGAIAVHLHSFSAQSLRNPEAFWAAPLLARGATATVGNVWEPYLQLTHHLDQFNAALLEGYTLAEAAGMSMPVLSWMSIVVGDPLYRPFVSRRVLTRETTRPGPDSSWMAIRVALARWKDDPKQCAAKLREAGRASKDAILLEAAGWLEYKEGRWEDARQDWETAATTRGLKLPDQLRCWMHVAESMLADKKKSLALKTLREAEKQFAAVPQIKAVSQHILRLDPPPPPPPQPKPAAPAAKPQPKPAAPGTKRAP